MISQSFLIYVGLPGLHCVSQDFHCGSLVVVSAESAVPVGGGGVVQIAQDEEIVYLPVIQ